MDGFCWDGDPRQSALGPVVNAMHSRLDTLKQSLESAVEGMSSEQLTWHLPGKWSAAEVLEHLYPTYTGTIKGLEKAIVRGASLATNPSMTQRALRFVVVRLGYIPAGLEAPGMVRPRGCRWNRCETRFGQNSRRWTRPSRSVKLASGATSNCSTIRFSVR